MRPARRCRSGLRPTRAARVIGSRVADFSVRRTGTTVGQWLRRQDPVLCGGMLLALCYAWAYFRYPELPGRRPDFPNGWWGWFDQSKTLQSATALARGDLAPSQHWYPLGYAILGAPFVVPLAAHAYFFVDLAALLLAFVAFCRFAGHAGIARPWGVGIFLAATLADRQIFDQWAIPWNTSPAAALTWLLLALVTRPRRSGRGAFAIGLVAGCIPLFRPTDAVLAAACLGAALLADLLQRPVRTAGRFWAGYWLRIIAGGVVPLLAYAGLHLAIYGPQETGYMRQSRALGFTLYDLPWKAYVILVDPRPWFHEGDGLLRRCPWLALALAGVVPALRRAWPNASPKWGASPEGASPALAILVAMLGAHAVLYLSYVDLLPTGLWRHDTVHYWIWALPGDALLGFVLLQDLARRGAARKVAIGCLGAAALLLCVHLDPTPVESGTPAKMLLFPGLTAKFDEAYYAPVVLRDAVGDQANVYAVRAFPAPDGLRVVALRRPFMGDVAWAPGHAPAWPGAADGPTAGPPIRWAIALRLGWPCWLPRSACRP